MTTRPKFLLFGSSIVQYSYYEGWASTLAHLYARKADIVLRGYAGWNSRRALEIIHNIVPKDATEAEQPALMIVYFGGNDSIPPHPTGLGPHVPLDEYISNMKNIAKHIMRVSPKTRIIFMSPPPINEEKANKNSDQDGSPKKSNELLHTYSEAVLEMCRQQNIKAIDLWHAIRSKEGWKDHCFLDDGVHLSPEGSKIVSDAIINILKEPTWEPSLYWMSMPSDFGEDSPYDTVLPDGTTINISNVPFPYGVEQRKLLAFTE